MILEKMHSIAFSHFNNEKNLEMLENGEGGKNKREFFNYTLFEKISNKNALGWIKVNLHDFPTLR